MYGHSCLRKESADSMPQDGVYFGSFLLCAKEWGRGVRYQILKARDETKAESRWVSEDPCGIWYFRARDFKILA
ncbi:hypothetical protein Mapa_014176 [Marchantia paleacea]|nr:hypothetical protein Mapa_014176 [Marchantia paleacea]